MKTILFCMQRSLSFSIAITSYIHIYTRIHKERDSLTLNFNPFLKYLCFSYRLGTTLLAASTALHE